MKTQYHPNGIRTIHPLWVAGCILMASHVASAQSVSWKVNIIPAGAGSIEWVTTSPVASGVLNKSSTLKFNTGSMLTLKFKTNEGYTLNEVYKNLDPWLRFLDSNKSYRFGPVSNPHNIVAMYTLNIPTGDFALEFPDGKAPMIADISGNYRGVTNDQRNYDADVAMDESGKLSVMGAVDGIEPHGGGPIQGNVGSVKTVNGAPTASLGGSFRGIMDDEPVTAKGKGTARPQTVNPSTGNIEEVTGTFAGNSKVASTKYVEKPTTLSFIPSNDQKANLSKSWTLDLKIVDVVDPRSGKKSQRASAILNLPDGQRVSFKERKIRYTLKNGYSVAFTKGIKVDKFGNPILNPINQKPQIHKKCAVKLIKMTMTGTVGNWQVSGGTIHYRFLGQKGSGNLVDFADASR